MARILICALFLIFCLSGCASTPFSNIGAISQAESANHHIWSPLPENGETILIFNKLSGAERSVVVIDSYYAASGRSCSLYTDTGGMNPSGIACLEDNRWTILPYITNPESMPSSS